MARDKAYGLLIFVISILIFLYYTYWSLLIPLNITFPYLVAPDTYWATAIPVWLGVTLILGIAAWIGWTMLTTPPPIPLEELEEVEELEAAGAETEEKAEEEVEAKPKSTRRRRAKKAKS